MRAASRAGTWRLVTVGNEASERSIAFTHLLLVWRSFGLRERLASEDPNFAPILTMLSECGRAVVVRCLSNPGISRPVSPCPPNGSRMPRRKGVDMADKSPRKVASKKSGKTLKDKRKEKKEKQETRKGLGI